MSQAAALYSSSQKAQRINTNILNHFSDILTMDNRKQFTLTVYYDNSSPPFRSSVRENQRNISQYGRDEEVLDFEHHNQNPIQMASEKSDQVNVLNLSFRKTSPQNFPIVIEALSCFQTLISLDLSSNYLGDRGIALLSSNQNKQLVLLEQLNLSENQFGHKGSKSLSLNIIWVKLKLLNLSGNPIRNKGIKFLAQNPAWTDLQVLVLNNIGLDYSGVKALAANESWEKLQELYLNDNPELGDHGLLALTYNKTWIFLQKLSIRNCGVKQNALKFIKRNKYWKDCKALVSGVSNNTHYSKQIVHNSMNSFFLTPESSRRRGKGKSTPEAAADLSELSSKINLFKERVKNKKILNRDLKLYIETQAKDNLLEDIDEYNIESFELDFKIKMCFLADDNSAKVLLITGGTGVGKSLFCRYFQRSVLMNWNPEAQQESSEKEWLPVSIDLSTLKNAKTAAASEALARELHLTESEIKLFQNSNSNSILPRLLFILDGYDAIQDTRELQGYQNSIQKNFYSSNGFGRDWTNAKIIITCREESLVDITQRDLVFAPIDEKRGVAIPGSYLEYIIQPFSRLEITAYMRKYVINKFPNTNEECNVDSGSHYPNSLRTNALSSWGLLKNMKKS